MNNSKFKKFLITILFVFATFFSLNINVKAATEVGGFLPYKRFHECSNKNDVRNFCYDRCEFDSNGNCKKDTVEPNRQLRQVGIYYIKEGSAYEHAYCIEPGVDAAFPGSGYGRTFNAKTKDINKVPNINLVRQILTFAPKLTVDDIKTLLKNYEDVNTVKGWNTANFKEDKYFPVFAAQGLIWEVILNQRTNFSNCSESSCAPQRNKISGGIAGKTFYDMIRLGTYNPYIQSENGYYINKDKWLNLGRIYNSYIEIVRNVHNAYEVDLKAATGVNFTTISSPASATKSQLKWDSGKFKLTFGSELLKYWKVDKNETTISYEEKKNSAGEVDAITLSSSSGVSEDQPLVLKLNLKGNTSAKNNIAFMQSGNTDMQDVIKVAGAPKSYYLYLYTPTYKLKVIKEDEKGKRLKGVSFYVCESNNYMKCDSSNSLKTITTDKNGEAVYDDLSKPGTYYVKEVKSLEGYVEDNKPHAIKVTNKNESNLGVFPIVSIKNKKKEFTLTKTVWTDDGEVALTSDDEWLENEEAGERTYIGPEFVIIASGNKGVKLTTSDDEPGIYYYSGVADDVKNATRLRTNDGKFKVYGLPDCSYTVEEKKAPEGQTLPDNPKLPFNACSANPSLTFVNGFTGLEFHKKNENGELLSGGEYTLQVKENNYYKDVLLTKTNDGIYSYSVSTKETDEDASYIFETKDGRAFIQNLPAGEYRVIEKSAPEGYELIEDKDSTALVTISDANKNDNYIVEMVDRKVSASGGEASAELVLTITTGRTILNYALIIVGLVVLLVLAYILRKKFKK